jgi:hypothetical protein
MRMRSGYHHARLAGIARRTPEARVHPFAAEVRIRLLRT